MNAEQYMAKRLNEKDATIRELRSEIRALNQDLRDVINLGPIPVRRCKACNRLALYDGYVCFACGVDPTLKPMELMK